MERIRSFGKPSPGARYVLRPGGYVVAHDPGAVGAIAVVETPAGCFLPGGGQEAGESAEEAAVRETREECGLAVRLTGPIGTADELVFAAGEATHFQKRCSFFRAEVVRRDDGGEADHRLVWMAPEEAAVRLQHGSQRWAVRVGCGLPDAS